MKFSEMSHSDAVRVENRPSFNRPYFNEPYEVNSQEYVMQRSGVVGKVGVKKMYDPKEEFKKYRCSDFALENIIAAGAVDSLRDMSVNMSSLNAAETADRVLDSIEAFENNNTEKSEE